MTAYAKFLPASVARRFTSDPARWLMRARSPLVRYRTAVDLLAWPPDSPEAATLWAGRHEDADVQAVMEGRGDDGLWRAPEALYRRRDGLYVPRFRATVWQLPLFADWGFGAEEPAVAPAVEALLGRRTDDGFFELGAGGPALFGNALAASSLSRLGVPAGELAGVRAWLAAKQRADGGWADPLELAAPEAPSTVATTAEVIRALGAEGGEAARRGLDYLRDNFFTEYNGRFPPSARPWRRFSWPQYNYDALSVATAMLEAGAPAAELAPLAGAVAELQTRRGFWRQQLPFGEPGWLEPVRAGRASRWITFRAAAFLVCYYDVNPDEGVAAGADINYNR